ncbi:unnamed protein product [Polarella glacialis]|uniref:Methyltransferase type 11 domain-containing protein n=1 Tax=Polarella glacialis TaxID=89957 RepID=A0A813LHS6_POLGL|nr:unnamed protein product [Polarella glacialis]
MLTTASSSAKLEGITRLPPLAEPHAEPQFPNLGYVNPASSVSDGSLDLVFVSVERGFAAYFSALVEWTPKLRAGGILVAFYALTTSDAAAAIYIFAAQRGLELHLATHRCAFFVK